MTRVYLEKDGDHYTVDAKGHATGSAEMCAAISCLMFTLAGWVHNQRGVRMETERLSSGDSRICFQSAGRYRRECDAVFLLILVGFRQLEKTDPARISVAVRSDF